MSGEAFPGGKRRKHNLQNSPAVDPSLVSPQVNYYYKLEVRGPIINLQLGGPPGPQLLVGGLSGRLDFVLRALWALRPRLTHQMRLTHQARQILFWTDKPTDKAILGVGL